MNPIYVFENSLCLLFIFSFCSCKKIEQSNPNTQAIGHGGMGISHTYPINTYESIYNCLAIGAGGVEFDLQLSEDSVWVVFHDEDLSPATNRNGKISEHQWRGIEEAYYMNPIYARYRLINANELLEGISNKEAFVFSLDLKNFKLNPTIDYTRMLAEKYVELVHDHKLLSNSYLSTNNLLLLEMVDSIDSNIDLFIYSGSDFEASMQLAIDKNFDGITIHIGSLNKQLVDEAHSFGLKVATFGINSSQKNTTAIEYGADFIETDQLPNLIKQLDA